MAVELAKVTHSHFQHPGTTSAAGTRTASMLKMPILAVLQLATTTFSEEDTCF